MFAKFRGPRVLPVAVSVIASLVLVLATVGTVVGDSGVQLTFYKEICPNYSDVPANASSGTLDVTRGHSADLDTTYGTGDTQHVVNDALHTNSYPNGDISAACAGVSGWKFSITDSGGTATYTTYTTGNGGVVAVPLTDDQIALAHSGTGLWVREETSDTAGFGSIRCYNDARNGDNLEQITNLPINVTQVYCVAYNVRQSITFATLPDVTYGVGPITLAATASSGLPVSYSTTGACSVNGTTLTITGSGSCSVKASQTGQANPFWSAAEPVTRTFTIAPAVLTVTANDASRAYGAANPTFTDSITGFVNGQNISVVSGSADLSTTAVLASPVGTYDITAAKGTLSATNYTFSFVKGTLSVGKAVLTVTAPTVTKVQGTDNPTLTPSYGGFATGDDANSLTTNPTCSTTATTDSPLGTYPVTCTGATADNYSFDYVAGTLRVLVGELNHIVISPDPATIVAGSTQAYSAEGFDSHGNSLGDVTAATVFTINGSGSACAATACGSTIVGDYKVTGTDGSLTDAAVLHVTAAATPIPSATPTATASASATSSATPSQSIEGATGTPSASSSQSQSLLGATGAPNVTPPVTSAPSDGSRGSNTPLFALLICLFFGAVAMVMVEKQRRTVRG